MTCVRAARAEPVLSTNMSPGMTFGHEITGEVIELGRDVEVVKLGDIVSGENTGRIFFV
jgi:threonine dehydrogenase-like Zn-dependent dehydrogenase